MPRPKRSAIPTFPNPSPVSARVAVVRTASADFFAPIFAVWAARDAVVWRGGGIDALRALRSARIGNVAAAAAALVKRYDTLPAATRAAVPCAALQALAQAAALVRDGDDAAATPHLAAVHRAVGYASEPVRPTESCGASAARPPK